VPRALDEPLTCVDRRKTIELVAEGSLKASPIGSARRWAVVNVNVAVEPQVMQRAGMKRERHERSSPLVFGRSKLTPAAAPALAGTSPGMPEGGAAVNAA
jgi:hypothetical protein